jgi:hypothetical protein
MMRGKTFRRRVEIHENFSRFRRKKQFWKKVSLSLGQRERRQVW